MNTSLPSSRSFSRIGRQRRQAGGAKAKAIRPVSLSVVGLGRDNSGSSKKKSGSGGLGRKLKRSLSLRQLGAHSIEDEVENASGNESNIPLSPSRARSNGAKGLSRGHKGRKVSESSKRGISPSLLSYIRKKFKKEAATKEAALSSSVDDLAATAKNHHQATDPSVQRVFVDDPDSLAHIDVKELEKIMKALEDKDTSIKQELQEQRALLRQAVQSLSSTGIEVEDEEEDPAVIPQSLPVTTKSCEIVHPGAECCTRTMVSISPSENKGTVTVEASVHPHYSGNQELNTQDMVALAALAIEKAGTRLFTHETHTLRKKRRNADRDASHRELVWLLQHGEIVSSRRSDHSSEFGHDSFLVELEDRESGRRIKALFKPKSEEGETSGWHRVEVERVAYSLNRLLGMDYVPPSAVRKGEILVDGKEFHEGCFTYFVEGAKQLSEVSTDLWDTSKEVFLSDTRILDVLIHNSDRHHGHFLFGKHWIQGDSLSMGDQEAEMMCAFLIDHAAGFRQEACVRLDHENAFMTGPTRVISARTYIHLRYLTAEVLEAKLTPYLALSEIYEVIRRKEAILDYFDGLVFFHGYENVVID